MTTAAHAYARAPYLEEQRKPTPVQPKVAPKRLEARTSPEIHSFIEHAAAVSGRSVTDLMLAGTMREAREAIEQAQVLRLSRESQLRFAEALLTPAAPNAALQKAAENAARLIASDE